LLLWTGRYFGFAGRLVSLYRYNIRSNLTRDSLIELPKASTDIQMATNIQVPTDDISLLSTEPAWPYEQMLGENDGSMSNFEILFHVAKVVRGAIQYIKLEETVKSSTSSYIVVESRLRNICFALIQAAGPNSLVFCDSIALGLRYDFAIPFLEQLNGVKRTYLAFY